MSCVRQTVIQTFKITVGGAETPVLVCKIAAGQVFVEEIAVQPNALCTVQFFEGLPPVNSLGNAISLQLAMPAGALWSKPGKVIQDDIYMVVTFVAPVTTVTLTGEVRYYPMTAAEGNQGGGLRFGSTTHG